MYKKGVINVNKKGELLHLNGETFKIAWMHKLFNM